MSADRIDKARLFEAYLVAAARTGDAAARARLVEAWQPRLVGHAWRLTGDTEMAREAVRAAGMEVVSVPIRGGTDGSRLTELGIPTPNIFTGMQEIHGPLEWISVQDMARATQACLNLVGLAAQKG